MIHSLLIKYGEKLPSKRNELREDFGGSGKIFLNNIRIVIRVQMVIYLYRLF